MRCVNNLKQIGLGLHAYHDMKGTLPPALLEPTQTAPKVDYPFISWLTRLLPFVEQPALYKSMQDAFAAQAAQGTMLYPWTDPPHIGLSTVVPTYKCPADSREYSAQFITAGPDSLPTGITIAFTAYLAVNGRNLRTSDGMIYWNSRVVFTDVTDGLSNTMMVGERPPSSDLIFGWWYAAAGQWDNFYSPLHNSGSCGVDLGAAEFNIKGNSLPELDACATGPYAFGQLYVPAGSAPGQFNGVGSILNPCDTFHFWSLHSGGSNFLFGDGAVRFINYDTPTAIMSALSTRAGGEPMGTPP
jgi:prepilin-type processing-associated H-X9-DG protein